MPAPKKKSAPVEEKKSFGAKDSGDSSEEDESNDFVNAELPDIEEPEYKPKPRRTSVSAESVDPNKMKAQKNKIVNIPKSPEVANNLLRVIGKSPLLKTLDSEQKSMLVNAFSGPITAEPGENIITQGKSSCH
jgi:hypothetical protein